ncbi:MAG: N-acetylmuramoyl-L-alanine amidase [Clostridiaceae bacterium]
MYLPKGSTISVDAGHNAYPDRGAVGIKVEDNLTKEVVAFLTTKFKVKGYNVVDCTPYNVVFNSVEESLKYRVDKANASGSSLHLCIHFNKFNGSINGSEAWIDSASSSDTEDYALQIVMELVKLGFYNRGVKVGDLYVPKNANMPYVLVECCFIDHVGDMGLYTGNSVADAIVKGVTGDVITGNPNSLVRYQAYVAQIGWQDYVLGGEVAGTEGRELPMESFVINLNGSGRIVIQGHVQDIGWQSERVDGEIIGTVGKDKRLEAIKIQLLDAPGYTINYQAHVEGIGWMPYVNNGEVAGTIGKKLGLEAIRIKVIKL